MSATSPPQPPQPPQSEPAPQSEQSQSPRPPGGQPPQPPQDDAAEGWLTPRLWPLEEEPPGAADLLPTPANPGDAPGLLLIERRLPLAQERLQQLAASLSTDEWQRHQAYRRPADRQRFLLGRAALRRLLGAWLELSPEAVPLVVGLHGKPLCPIGPQFNLSHSGDLILLALHPQRPVGVDVEQLRPDLDEPALAQRLFSDSERLALERCPAARRPEAFLAFWCRLEARLKARGTGLVGLESMRAQERQIAAMGPRSADATPARERIWDVRVPSGYRAAVALAAAGPGLAGAGPGLAAAALTDPAGPTAAPDRSDPQA